MFKAKLKNWRALFVKQHSFKHVVYMTLSIQTHKVLVMEDAKWKNPSTLTESVSFNIKDNYKK